MPDTTDFAAALIAARAGGTRFVPGVDVPETREEAYAVQAAVAAHFGAVGGFKTARVPGVEPIMAPIMADRVIASGDACAAGDQMGVELEVGFEVLRPLPTGDWPSDIAAYLRPRPVIELVDTRIEGSVADDPIVKLADLQVNHGLVTGPALSDWDGTDFGTVQARMVCGGEVLLEGPAEVPGGSALETLRGLAAIIGNHCGGFRPGQILITGSLHPMRFFPAGTEVRGEIAGLGEVSVSLT